jgi:hypothetical protein
MGIVRGFAASERITGTEWGECTDVSVNSNELSIQVGNSLGRIGYFDFEFS